MRLGRVNQMQFFRFIAFFLLFEYHASIWVPNYANNSVSGLFALFFFILLSGVMSSYSLYSKEDIAPTASNIFYYVKKKVFRFYPLYLVTNLIAVIYTVPTYMVSLHNYKEVLVKAFEFIATIFMFQTWIFRPYVYNAASWYVASIVWLSILNIPFSHISRKIMVKDKAIRKFVGIAVLGVIYSLLASAFSMAVLHLSEADGITAHPLIIGGIYITGMAIGNIVIILKERLQAANVNTKLFTAIEITLVALSLVVIEYKGSGNMFIYVLPIFLDCALLIVFMLGFGKISKLFSKKFFVMLGNITFEAYLLHQVIIFLFATSNNWASGSTLGNIYALTFCFTTSLVAAAIIYNTKNMSRSRYQEQMKIKNDIAPIRKNVFETAI